MQVSLLIDGVAYPLEAVPADKLVEHGRYRLRLAEERPDPDVDRYQAEAGEVPLPLVRARAANGQVLLEWEWSPEFFTGEFAFVVRYHGERLYPPAGEERRWLVRPDLRKLTRDDYEAMLADLVQWTSGWLSPSPGQLQGASSGAPADAPLAQLELLLRAWPGLERLVEQVIERPRHKLVQRTVDTPLHRLQTVTGRQWQAAVGRQALWSPQPAPRSAALARVHGQLGGLLPEAIPQASAYLTLAVPENIFVVTLLSDIRLGLMRVIDLLEGWGSSGTPQRAVAERRTEQARGMLKRVSAWLRSTWLSELEPVSGAVEPTPALLKHPVYGALWRFYLQWRRAVTVLDGAGRPLPLDRTYQLYEYWCFLTVVRAVAAHLGRDPDTAAGGVVTREGASLRLDLVPGKSLRLPFREADITVTYQRSFRYHPDGGRLFSCSHQQIPDIAVEWTRADGAPALLLFDPKYRVNHDGVLAGLGDMHRYRDAIVTADGRRAVAAGFLLCPEEPADLGDRRYVQEAYQDRWDFGICWLSPGGGVESVERVLARYLGS